MTGMHRRVEAQTVPARGFDHVDTWVFDLDNTLYPAHCKLFDQVDRRMGSFISELLGLEPAEARALQKTYFREYGTTLAGLMACHGIDPHAFLDYVHDIDLSVLTEDAELSRAIAALPGRRFVFTNGSRQHAANVLDRIGLSSLFDDVFDIADADFVPKPDPACYERFLAKVACSATTAAMFEDIARNLIEPHQLGMTTVLVHSPANEDGAMIHSWAGISGDEDYIHHRTDDLRGFLCEIAPASRGCGGTA